MDPLLPVEIDVILALQSLAAWLLIPMEFLSFLGTEDAFMVIMPFFYWCLDAGWGLRVGLMLLLTNGVNGYFKLAFHTARPYWFDSRVTAFSAETSFGMPSGHAQNAISIWGLLGYGIHQKWGVRFALGLGVLLAVLIGFSRLYLGMHFVRDVVVGWVIGGLLLILFVRWMDRVRDWYLARTYGQQLAIAAGSSLVMIAVMLVIYAFTYTWPIPAEWQANAALATPDHPIDPFSLKGIFTAAGTWLGVTVGATWFYHRYGMFDASGTVAQKFGRYVIGVTGVLALYLGLGAVFPNNNDVLSFVLRYIRYTLIGLWVIGIAPLVFMKIGLAHKSMEKISLSVSSD